MSVILYSQGCTPCLDKALWKRLKAAAAKKHVLLERRDINKDLVARNDAYTFYRLPLPFVVEDGRAKSAEEWINE